MFGQQKRDRTKNSKFVSWRDGEREALHISFIWLSDVCHFIFIALKIMTTTESVNPSNHLNRSPTASPASFNLAGDTVAAPTTAIPSSASTLARDRCRRCQQLVYVTERIGPVKELLYHKLCFKCVKCDRQLDLKTYFTNSMDIKDKEIYCQSHAPRSGKGVFSTENMHIQNVMKAPKLNLMQKLDDRPKVSLFVRSCQCWDLFFCQGDTPRFSIRCDRSCCQSATNVWPRSGQNLG